MVGDRSWNSSWGRYGFGGGNYGWPFYPSFVKPLVKKKCE